MTIPDETTWMRIMPAWCAGRRGELTSRVRHHADRVRVTLCESATSDGSAILWIEKGADGAKRPHRIDW